MKYKILFICLNIIILLAIFFTSNPQVIRDNHLVIAAVSMSGKYKEIGRDMLNGIQLYLNTINSKGGINGRKVKLDVYDDKGNTDTAIKVAMEISKKNNALLVLGHYFSSTSLAAGNVYLKSRIPVITGSATAETITKKNEWFFSIAPNNSFQGEFIANYIRSSLNYKTCSIVYDENDYGKSLYHSFQSKAHMIGLEIKNTWHFCKNNPQFTSQFNKLISQLRSSSNPGIIFVATHAIEAVKIISSLKYPGSTHKIIGPDSFSTNSFILYLNRLPQEKSSPGYYSNGIYTTTPFISDLANNYNQQFISEYMNMFGKKPSWVSACYYDATLIAAKAMQEIEDTKKIRSNRIQIKQFLESKYNVQTSEKGVTGPLFFESDRNVKNPLRVCFFKNQELVPDYFQYNLISRSSETNNFFDKILSHQLLTSGNLVMNKTRIVFTGFHINKISNFDIQSGSFNMDFFMWFKFKGDFDEKQIHFLNSTSVINLNTVIADYKEGEVVTRVYHIKGNFTSLLDFHRFPFETHDLFIRFRHKNQTSEKLIYIPDNINESYLNKLLKIEGIKTDIEMKGWGICDTFKYNGIVSYESSLGIPVKYHLKRPVVYSICTAGVRIKRNTIAFAAKISGPAIALFTLFLSVAFFHFRNDFFYFGTLLSIMIISSLFLVKTFLFIEAPYMLFIQYVYLFLFIGSVSGLLLNFIHHLLKNKWSQIIIFSRLFRIFILIFMVSFFIYGYISYKPLKIDEVIHVYKKPQTLIDSSSNK